MNIERVLCCVGLRWHKHELEQCLRIQSEIPMNGSVRLALREEWRPVPGIKSRTLWSEKVDWESVDWSLNNNQIAAKTGCQAGLVARFRRRLGKPPSPGIASRKVAVTKEMLEATDWEYVRDIDLAAAWGVTREYARQMRMFHGKPCLISARTSPVRIEAAKWVMEHRSEIEGKHIHDVTRNMPFTLNLVTKRAILRQSEIKFDWGKRRYFSRIRSRNMNWSLPNSILVKVWGESTYNIANFRCRNSPGKAKWFLSGHNPKAASNPKLLAAVDAEVAKAREAGITADGDGIKQWIKSLANRQAQSA